MTNAIEQKVDVSGAVGDLKLTVVQRPDSPAGKSQIPIIPASSAGRCVRLNIEFAFPVDNHYRVPSLTLRDTLV